MSVFKPVVTGLSDAEQGPPDHERLRASARSSQSAADVSPYLFDPPVSPHLAADVGALSGRAARAPRGGAPRAGLG